ncbi:potassium:proton antiporter [Acuticoccus sediminis]|uniref:Potassium:proton antiporter n=1 Tax=Acuticoccus sediminis TaxID=2184697 RepID=A0A8B2NV28_9HYPH|nr:monovalent cation/H(+) antiporter subunit G [Acuticoccus sediminis]RAI02349.1 potassium:proton antiporter [Acuticoccus sediminis]
MSALIALLLKVVGVGFLVIAAVGVLRLADPFQRMHAATKAGTLGAGLVVLGTLVGQQASDVTVIGTLTILFLLLTVPVAGHLLGRAAYISGTPMEGLSRGDALDGVLARQAVPPSERIGSARRPFAPSTDPSAAEADGTRSTTPGPALEPLTDVRLGLIRGQEDRTFARALAIAAAHGVSLTAHAIVDSRTIERAEDRGDTRSRIRKACAEAMEALQGHMERAGAELSVRYDEGVPEDVLCHGEPGRCLLVVPQDGWFHHGVDPVHSDMSWAPDGLLHLPSVHVGPVLYAGIAPEGDEVTLALYDNDEPHLGDLLDWSLQSRLWPVGTVCHVGRAGDARLAGLERIAAGHGVRFVPLPAGRGRSAGDAAMLAGADAAILGTMPRPLRTRWYGMAWTERIAPGFRGDVLAMETPD